MSTIDQSLSATATIEGVDQLSPEDRALINIAIDQTLRAAAEFTCGNVVEGFTFAKMAEQSRAKLSRQGAVALMFGRVRKA